jgi:hypothetical protein
MKRPSPADVLDALRTLGGEARTLVIRDSLTPVSLDRIRKQLDKLEAMGRVTSSLTLDGLERIWTINGGER